MSNVQKVKNELAQSIEPSEDSIDGLTEQVEELIGQGSFPGGLFPDAHDTTNAGGEASSSSATNDWNYDVFLSFRGKDTRHNFTSHLDRALRKEKINVFMDKDLERGKEITDALIQKIQHSRISLVVFSPDFASSSCCLDELVKILECKESIGQVVLPVFYNVDPTDVEELRGNYAKAFTEHEIKFSQKVERWKSALAKTATLSGWTINTCNDDEAERIEIIVKMVLEMLHYDVAKDAFSTSKMVGEACWRNMSRILECLSKNYISRIGIYGMAGVGKTTLMIHVHNYLLKKPEAFGQVYWVTVSRHESEDFSVSKLQDLIAKTIKIDFKCEEDEKKRAVKLSNELKKKGKCILILDDLWNYFSEEKVGLPVGVNKCQLILTSRSQEIFKRLDCQENIKVETLDEEDSWNLFKEKFGIGMSPSPKIDEIAKSIVKECAGLPLGIMTMAGTMKGVHDISEWRDVLNQLRESKFGKDEMEDDVFRVLRVSYDRLKDQQCRKCFLYCALYPEDYRIQRTELIENFIVEGIIEKMVRKQDQHDRGHSLLNKLENVSMLEDSSFDVAFLDVNMRCVKMHDLLRDMAPQIMKSKGIEVLVNGKAAEYWTKDLIRVSLTDGRLNKKPLTTSPNCPNLLTLLLCRNYCNFWSNADSFFQFMPALKILDLSSTYIEELPDSVTSLTNLVALLLYKCSALRRMPSLAMLSALEKFDLFCTWSLEAAPEGMELPLNLRYLNLLGSNVTLQKGMLRRLKHLQVLAFEFTIETPEEIIRELSCLQELEKLLCHFYGVGAYNSYIDQLDDDKQRPSYHYSLDVSGKNRFRSDVFFNRDDFYQFFLASDLRYVYLGRIRTNQREIKLPRDTEKLEIEGYEGKVLHGREEDLSDLTVQENGMIEFLSDFFSSSFMFQSLKKIKLEALPNLHLLFKGSVNSAVLPRIMPPPPHGAFSNLQTFHIYHCNKIEKLFSLALLRNLQNLQELVVISCEQLEEIVASEEVEESNSSSNNNQYNLPQLKVLHLENLPELISIIGSGKLVCKSIQQVVIVSCEKVENIPIPLPLPSLQSVDVWGKEWWESVQWDSSTNKDVLLPFLNL